MIKLLDLPFQEHDGDKGQGIAEISVNLAEQPACDAEVHEGPYFNQKRWLAYKVVNGMTVWCDTIGPPNNSTGSSTEEQVATWADGSTWQIPGLLVSPPPLQSSSSATATTKAATDTKIIIFEAERDGRKVMVKPSFRKGIKDIILWLQPSEQKKTQVLLINCKGFQKLKRKRSLSS